MSLIEIGSPAQGKSSLDDIWRTNAGTWAIVRKSPRRGWAV